jgi:hypothetical protein
MERSQLPSELLLLEYDRVSELLNDSTFWSTTSLLVSILLVATNGSVLAHAYANPPPTRIMRSDATSYSATYTAYMNTAGTNHDDTGVTRCADGQATIITPVTPHVLLAVTGKASESTTADRTSSSSSSSISSSHHGQAANESSEIPQRDLDILISISDELGSLLRTELSDMRWPEDY